MVTQANIFRVAIILPFILMVQGCGGNGFVDTLPTQPTIATQQPSVVSAKGATLSGVVNPMGNNVEAWFEWGAGDASSNSTDAVSLGSNDKDIPVKYSLDGVLLPKTVYRYRLVVKNLDDNEIIKGEQEQVFTTPAVPAPTVTTVAQASGSAGSSGLCEFHATVNSSGFSAEGWFEWGLDEHYGNQTTRQKIGNSSDDVDLVDSIEQDPSAAGGTTYHYRAVAENEGGQTVGDDALCTTAVKTAVDDPGLDTDGDGLNNHEEINTYHTDPLKADTDGDGLNDGDEVNTYHTDPLKADSDGDGLSDGAEVNTYHTDPLKADTDGDSASDGLEVAVGSDPLSAGSTPPDLTLTLINGQENAMLGQGITVSNTVKNQGSTAAGGFMVDIYLSPNSTIPDGDDIYVGSYNLSSLAGGQLHTDNTPLVIPALLPVGSYYLGAVVDVNNTVGESNEQNNAIVASQTINISKGVDAGDGSDGALNVMGAIFNLLTDDSFDALGNSDDGNPHQPDGFATRLTTDASAGATRLSVASTAGFVNGDEVMIIQISHATNHGVYEFIKDIYVEDGATLSFDTALTHNYYVDNAATDRVQVVRVPHYSTVTVGAGGALTTDAYNHATGIGGIVVLRAATVINDGTIGGDGLGFQGGPSAGQTSMAGYQGRSYTGLALQRSVSANQGGGGGGELGTTYGAGGGGYGVNGNNSYYGTGGASYGDADLARMYLGSGGGSGGTTNCGGCTASGSGGAGGGIVYVAADSITGGGTIKATGHRGHDYVSSGGAGGGGSGGTVRMQATVWSMSVNVAGGSGGIGSRSDGLENAGAGGRGRSSVAVGAPDLVVTDVSGPATAGRGDSISVTSTVKDQRSDAATAPFRVGIYMSPYPDITADDTFLGEYSVASLAGNASITTPVNVTIPSNLYADSPAGYQYRKKISIDAGKVSGANTLRDFPVLLDISDPDLRSAANGGKVQSDNGYDLLFTDIVGGSLQYELEAYDATTGHFRAWVKVPKLSGGMNTDFYLYYGNGAIVASQANASGTWNGQYQAVFHQDETPGVSSQLDSTGNGDNAANINMAGAQNVVDAVIGKGIAFDGVDDYQRTQASVLDTGKNDWSIEAWVKLDALHSGKNYLVQSEDNPLGQGLLYVDGGDGKLYSEAGGLAYASGQMMVPGTWYHLVLVHDHINDKLQWYVNGAWVTTTSNAHFDSNNGRWRFGVGKDGSGALAGVLDEVRVSDVQRSPQWIETEYDNMTSPATFYSVGAEESSTSFTSQHPFYIGAIADYKDTVVELNEFNNSEVTRDSSEMPQQIIIDH